jgi:hypothetical protein
MNQIEKIRSRHSQQRRPRPQPVDKRRLYRAGRESKAYTLPTQPTTQKGAHR